MKKLILGLLLVSSNVMAQNYYGHQQTHYGSTYSPSTGNSYNYSSTPGVGSSYTGYNYNTGSTWSGSSDAHGNQHGIDSHGNSWNYNSSTGAYTNYGTGKFCNGSGASRVCTGGK